MSRYIHTSDVARCLNQSSQFSVKSQDVEGMIWDLGVESYQGNVICWSKLKVFASRIWDCRNKKNKIPKENFLKRAFNLSFET